MANRQFTVDDLIVLHEDRHVIVVVKPANVPSQADESGDADMLTVVKQYLMKEYDKESAYCGLVHRLDRPTGGVMVFAKTSKAAERLCEQIKSGEFEKTYFCVTCGVPREKSSTLVHYLKKNEAKNVVMVVPMLTEGAKKATGLCACASKVVHGQVASDPRADVDDRLSAVRRRQVRCRPAYCRARPRALGDRTSLCPPGKQGDDELHRLSSRRYGTVEGVRNGQVPQRLRDQAHVQRLR